jgi:hypothetical protein
VQESPLAPTEEAMRAADALARLDADKSGIDLDVR